MTRWEDFLDHAFKGPRFDDGALDVEVMAELSAYRALVVRLAEEIWRRNHQDRQRLPRRFEDDFRLRCTRIEPGSSVAVLQRNRNTPDQLDFVATDDDAFDEAIVLLSAAMNAANDGVALPSSFPRKVLPLFRSWGRELREGETIELRSRKHPNVQAQYSASTRAQMLSMIDVAYQDAAESVGHVLATSIRHGRFELYPDPTSSYGIDVPLSHEHEQVVLSALSAYSDAKVAVKGRAAFSGDGRIIRFTEVESVQTIDASPVDNSQLWAQLAALSASVDSSVWDGVPADASQRVDAYLQQPA